MGLDPNDIRLRIEADVSAPGAQQAADQLRGAGQAADETRASFDRLRQTTGQNGAQAVVAAPPVSQAAAGRDPQIANDLVRALVQQRQATEDVFRNAVASVRATTGVRPTITPQDLGIAAPPAPPSEPPRRPPRATGATDGDDGGNGRPGASNVGQINVSPAMSALLTAESKSQVEADQAERARQQQIIAQWGREQIDQQRTAEARARTEGAAFSQLGSQRLVDPNRLVPNDLRPAGQQVGGQGGDSGLAGMFNLSTQSLTRAGLALTGVGAGLNALVTVTRRVHDEMVAAVEAQVTFAKQSRELAANYGPAVGGQLQAQAASFTANPQTRGSEQDYLQSAASLHQLSSEYGLNNDQVNTLITNAGNLARIHNTELTPAVQALEGVLRGNVDAAQAYGISLADADGRIRGVGATYDQLVGTVGRARAEQILYQQILQQSDQQQANSTQAIDSTASALDRLQKAAVQARQELAQMSAQPFNVVVNVAARLAQAVPQGAQIAGAVASTNPIVAVVPAAQQVSQGLQAAGQFVNNAVNQIAGDNPSLRGGINAALALPEAAFGIPQPKIAAPDTESAARVEQSAVRASSAVTNVGTAFERMASQVQGELIPALQRLSSTQQLISGLGQIGQALQGPDAAYTGGDIRGRAAVQAAQDVVARQRLRDAQAVGGIVQDAAAIDPNEAARRTAAYGAVDQAQLAQQTAGRAQQAAQAGVSALDLVDQQRQLDAAGELASLRTETLDREGGIVDLQRQEADIADRMRVANRENLDLLQQQTRARLDSLQASNQLNDLQYSRQRDTLQIQATRADVRRGVLDPSALQQIPDLRQQLRAETLATPRAELTALEAGRPAELAGRAIQQDQLSRALQAIPLEQQQRGVEDQLTPLQQIQRLTDERTQALNRQLEIARLAEEPQRTAAEQNVLAATAVSLAADQSVRSAQEWAANIHDGLTDLQRAWTLVQGIAPGPGAGSAYPNPTPDRQPANLGQSTAPVGPIGTGALPSSGGDTYQINVTVPGSTASPEQIANAVLGALNRRSLSAPRAAPRTLVGAR